MDFRSQFAQAQRKDRLTIYLFVWNIQIDLQRQELMQ